jgi:hypothetical protein
MQLRSIWSIFSVLLLAGASAFAQNSFISGSTGADGAFAPTQNQTITVPPSGVFNYTTVNIPSGVTITYLRNSTNTPLTILANGDVQISGSILADGQPGGNVGFGGLGGPGGGSGGAAGVDGAGGSIGDGPGAGRGGQLQSFTSQTCVGGGGGGGYQAAGNTGGTSPFFNCSTNTGGAGGAKYGTQFLTPLLGGSGGGGGTAVAGTVGGGGGGGGGAVLIASSTTILLNGGTVAARGGNGPNVGFFNGASGGAGSGGAIRLVANTVSGSGQLLVNGGLGGFPGGANGGFGFVRVEAFSLSGFNLQNNTPVSSGLPTSVNPANAPGLQITSVGGVNAPANPSGSFQGAPDVILPANQPNPVTVIVTGLNIPTGTAVNVTATSASGASTTATGTLSGTTASSTASASISLSAGFNVLTATTVVDLAQIGDLKPLFINGERVDKLEVAATFGGGSSVTYITHSGRRINSLR